MVLLKQGSNTDPEPAMRQSWPSEYATSMEYPETGGTVATSDGHEAHAIRCRNCGFPIVDSRKHSECPHCETTNFRGDV